MNKSAEPAAAAAASTLTFHPTMECGVAREETKAPYRDFKAVVGGN